MTEVKKNNKNTEPNFEEALKSLEQIVQAMENQQLSLEASLKYFEEGVALSSLCAQKLADAELKIKTISQAIK